MGEAKSVTAGCLARLLDRGDRESEFRQSRRQALLSEAFRRLCEALHPEPIEARTDRGFLFRLKNDFDRLRPAALWFDRERQAALRQDLGLDPLPDDFELPEIPGELLDSHSGERRRLLRKMREASWTGYEAALWEEDHTGILFRPEEAAEMEAGRFSMEDWKRKYVDGAM